MARNLYLIRHGQVEKRFIGKLVGATDVDLSPMGLKQATCLNQVLSRKLPDICFSSPMRRCLQTAKHAMNALDIELIRQESLREVDFGEWEGLGFEEIIQLDPEKVEKWIRCDPDFQFPRGESLAAFKKRVENAIDLLVKNPNNSIAVFTHGGVVRFMLCILLGLPLHKHPIFEVNYADVYTLKISTNGAILSGVLNIEDM